MGQYGNDNLIRSTIQKYQDGGGLISKRSLAEAFDELNIPNPHYAASEVMGLLNKGNQGFIQLANPNEANQVLTYASSIVPRPQYQPYELYNNGYGMLPPTTFYSPRRQPWENMYNNPYQPFMQPNGYGYPQMALPPWRYRRGFNGFY